jgi:ParB family chromosome partitioning protein
MSKERRLGRGLEALLGRIPPADAGDGPFAANPAAPQQPAEGPYGGRSEEPYAVPFPFQQPRADDDAQPAAPTPEPRIEIGRIDSNPYQPRQDFNEVDTQALAESLKSHGLLQPVVVRRLGDRYQLVAGERRLRAAVQAGWTDVPAVVIEADDRQVAELAIIENVQRKDLNALEKAASFQRYLEQYGCTQEQLAGRLHIDRSTVANLIRLLELPAAIQDAVRQGKLFQGHARALLPLGDEREQVALGQRIQRDGLSVRQTEALVQEMIDQADAEPLGVIGRDGEKSPTGQRPKSPRGQSEHIAALEQQFRSTLGLRVALRANSRGRGKLVIQFRSHEEFEQLREQICGTARSKAKSQAG